MINDQRINKMGLEIERMEVRQKEILAVLKRIESPLGSVLKPVIYSSDTNFSLSKEENDRIKCLLKEKNEKDTP